LITHDMQLVARYAQRGVLLEAGRVAAAGSPRELFGRSELLRRAGILPPPVVALARELLPAAQGPGTPLDAEEFCRAYQELAGPHG
jgi:energy-coupling factor transport system ATP-binding protein